MDWLSILIIGLSFVLIIFFGVLTLTLHKKVARNNSKLVASGTQFLKFDYFSRRIKPWRQAKNDPGTLFKFSKVEKWTKLDTFVEQFDESVRRKFDYMFELFEKNESQVFHAESHINDSTNQKYKFTIRFKKLYDEDDILIIVDWTVLRDEKNKKKQFARKRNNTWKLNKVKI